MFRFPSFSEILALFYQPTKVEQAIKSIETAALRADNVASFNTSQKERAATEAAKLRARAEEEAGKADDHSTEAARAARVSTRLRELVA